MLRLTIALLASCLPSPDDPGGEGETGNGSSNEPTQGPTSAPTGGVTTTGETDASSTGEVGSTSGAGTTSGATTLSPAPGCGNGIVEGDEECDDGLGDAEGPCVPALCVRPMLVFRTAAHLPATTLSGGVGGLAGADEACAREASQGGYPGLYKAWLSTGLSSPRRRFVRRTGVGYALLHQSRTVAWSFDDLFLGGGNFGIDEDAQGVVYDDPGGSVWTATGPDGLRAGEGTCFDWTVAEGAVVRGRYTAKTAPDWTAWQPPDDPLISCREHLPVYCFRQGEDCVDRARVAGRAACEDVELVPDCFEDSIDFAGPQGACEDMLTACDFVGVPCPVTRELCAEVAAACA